MSNKKDDDPDFLLKQIYTAIYGEHGLLVRVGKIEKELQMYRWFIPLGVAVAIFLAELAVRLLIH